MIEQAEVSLEEEYRAQFLWVNIERVCALRGITVEQWCEELAKSTLEGYKRWKEGAAAGGATKGKDAGDER